MNALRTAALILLVVDAYLALVAYLLSPLVKPWDSPEERALMFAGGRVQEARAREYLRQNGRKS